MFLKTPFDRIIASLEEKSGLSDLEIFLHQSLRRLSIIYTYMLDDARYFETHTAPYSDSILTKPVLDYFTFICELNQTGKILCQKYRCKPLPLQNRVNFFRNTVVEHWDAYVSLINRSSFGGQIGKILCPLIHGKKRFGSEISDARQIIIDEFKKQYIDFKIEDCLEYSSVFAEKVYLALEKIDKGLHNEPKCNLKDRAKCPHCKSASVGIPKSLINSLFDYEFPCPFYDVEAYSNDLVDFFQKLLDDYKVKAT